MINVIKTNPHDVLPNNLNRHIFVTRPSLPPLTEIYPYLEEIWRTRTVTNSGPFHQQLESELCAYLGVSYISLFCNATIALITALKALNISGEVITTPYSFVATAHSLHWNGVKPIFVDIDPITLNLDPMRIEAAITHSTTAIMPVHVYGHPCNVDAIDEIAKHYKLKVIYDAAHAFGVKCHCGSVLNYGDLSVLSFHATKVFNTFEGGAIVCHDANTKRLIDELKNFGFTSEITVMQTGINGKMSEFNAALGLAQLRRIDNAIKRRKDIDFRYREGLRNIKGIRCHVECSYQNSNFGYFPIFITEDYPLTRNELYEYLKLNGFHTRRYFYPLISSLPMYEEQSIHKESIINSTRVAEQVLCLPIYEELEHSDADRVISLLQR